MKKRLGRAMLLFAVCLVVLSFSSAKADTYNMKDYFILSQNSYWHYIGWEGGSAEDNFKWEVLADAKDVGGGKQAVQIKTTTDEATDERNNDIDYWVLESNGDLIYYGYYEAGIGNGSLPAQDIVLTDPVRFGKDAMEIGVPLTDTGAATVKVTYPPYGTFTLSGTVNVTTTITGVIPVRSTPIGGFTNVLRVLVNMTVTVSIPIVGERQFVLKDNTFFLKQNIGMVVQDQEPDANDAELQAIDDGKVNNVAIVADQPAPTPTPETTITPTPTETPAITPTPTAIPPVVVDNELWGTQGNWAAYAITVPAPSSIAQWSNGALQCTWQNPLPSPGFFQWLQENSSHTGLEYDIPYQANSIYVAATRMSASKDTAAPQIRLRVQSSDSVWATMGLFGSTDASGANGAPSTIPSEFYMVFEPQGSTADMFYAADIYQTTTNTGTVSLESYQIFRVPTPSSGMTEFSSSDFSTWSTIGSGIEINQCITYTNTASFQLAGSYIKLYDNLSPNTVYRLQYDIKKSDSTNAVDQIRMRCADSFNGFYSTNFVYNDHLPAATTHLTTTSQPFYHYHWAMNETCVDPVSDLTVYLDSIDALTGGADTVLTGFSVQKIGLPTLE